MKFNFVQKIKLKNNFYCHDTAPLQPTQKYSDTFPTALIIELNYPMIFTYFSSYKTI